MEGYDEVECRYCHRGGFIWDQRKEGWRLVTPTGRVHKCKTYQATRGTL